MHRALGERAAQQLETQSAGQPACTIPPAPATSSGCVMRTFSLSSSGTNLWELVVILQAQASLFIASNSHYKPFSSAHHLPSADGVSESTDLKPSEIFYVTCLSFVGLIKPIPPLPPDHYFPVLFFILSTQKELEVSPWVPF